MDLNELSDTIDLIFLNDNINILSVLLLLSVSLTFLWHISLIYSINVRIKIKFNRISQEKSFFLINDYLQNISVSSQF